MSPMATIPHIPPPQIHTHNSPRESLIPLLQSHLPYSGPLLRRIQHNQTNPSRTARCLTTFSPVKCPVQQKTPTSSDTPPWLAAYVDVHAGRETQVWIYSSLEPRSKREPQGDDGVSTFFGTEISSAAIEETRAQLVALLAYIRTELLPGYLSTLKGTSELDSLLENGSVEGTQRIPAHPSTSILIGSLHSGLLELLTTPSPEKGFRHVHVHRTYHPNVKYIFSRTKYAQQLGADGNAGLPPGYRLHDRKGRHGLQPHQVPLVQDRTYIFRSRELLMSLASAVVYHDEDGMDRSQDGEDDEENPVSWVFLGYDGSLMTLHVEPKHRGKGLAVQVGQEVMRSGMSADSNLFELGGDTSEEKGWVFADVMMDNVASRRVMEKMGGEVEWTLAWAVVEVCQEGECSYCAQNKNKGS